MSTAKNRTVENLAQRIGNFSVVPFVGAGCPKRLLGGNDWSGITRATEAALDLPASNGLSPTEVAECFVEKFGRERLEEFLRERLTLSDFDDLLGGSYLALLALHFMTLYTTNVDNIFELAFEKYGRPLKTISTLSDLQSVMADAAVLYKYHGCLTQPSTKSCSVQNTPPSFKLPHHSFC